MKKLIFLMLIQTATYTSVAQAQPTNNFWTKKNDFSGAKRERAVAFAIGDYGYLSTGIDTAELVKKDLWRYDPLSDSWQQMADLPGVARRDAIAFTSNDKGYVGLGIDNSFSFSGNKLKDLWEYDPLANSWAQKADFPGGNGNGLYFSTAFSIDSKGYVCCGKIGPNLYSNQLWEYKPSIDEWTQKATFPGGVRYQLSSFAIGNYGYVGLGANQDVFKKDFWRYNPGNNTWMQIADLPGSQRGNAVSFTINNRGFVCMGSDGSLLDDLWEYNPDNDHWSVRANYGGSERKNAVGFVVNGKAYVGTGKGYSGKKQSFEEYTPFNFAGIDENTEINLSVFPNPSSEIVHCVVNTAKIQQLKLINCLGQELIEVKANVIGETLIDVRDFVQGTYYLVALDDEKNYLSTQAIIVY